MPNRIIVAQGRNYTVYVDDANHDGVYNEGERLSVREGRGSLSHRQSDVDGVLERLGVHELRPGIRIEPFRAYLDQLRHARQSASAGNPEHTVNHILQAQDYARQAGIQADHRELARIGSRCIEQWCQKRYEHGGDRERDKIQRFLDQIQREISRAPSEVTQTDRALNVLRDLPRLTDFQEQGEPLALNED